MSTQQHVDADLPHREQTLFLVRHGQTALNAEGRLRGLADPPLDSRGEQEAKAVAAALAPDAPGHVATSPLQRAAMTGAMIAAASDGATVSSDPRFNDRDYGPWTGAIRSEVIAQWGSLDAAPGVEPVSRVLERALPALDAVLEEHPETTVVVVTHDAVIRPLLLAIDPRLRDVLVPTASWSRLVRAAGKWTIREVDRTALP